MYTKYMPGTQQGQKKVLDTLELVLCMGGCEPPLDVRNWTQVLFENIQFS